MLGGEGLVRGSARLARLLGVSTLVIGLTLVSFGTSAPELAVSLIAAARGASLIAVGNAVGSNICNIGLILGLSALIRPLKIEWSLVKGEVPFLLVASSVFYLLAFNRGMEKSDGVLLFLGFLVFLAFIYRRKGKALEVEVSLVESVPSEGKAKALAKGALLTLGGLGILLLGGEVAVSSGREIARWMRVSEGVIGLSIVAVGTSLPELAVSTIAAARKEYHISVGNILGSNTFNLLAVVGLASLIRPLPLEREWLLVQIPVMLFFSLALLPIMWDKSIRRWEGALLLGCYGTFVLWLFRG